VLKELNTFGSVLETAHRILVQPVKPLVQLLMRVLPIRQIVNVDIRHLRSIHIPHGDSVHPTPDTQTLEAPRAVWPVVAGGECVNVAQYFVYNAMSVVVGSAHTV
jgi:hypothetical protein